MSISVPRLRSVFDGCMAVGAGVALAGLLDRKIVVESDRPPVRAFRTVPSIVVIGSLLVAIAGAGVVWRSHTQDRARRAVVAAAERDGDALGALAADSRRAQAAHRLPQFDHTDLDRARDLVTMLGQRAPQVESELRGRVGDALRTTRVAAHEADVIALLSAAEELNAAAEHRPASVAAVRERYEREIRPGDPTLEPWSDVMSGALLERGERAVAQLR